MYTDGKPSREDDSPVNSNNGQHKFTNRLIHEKSPYLLQHAHNPVDLYPWGPEAFQKAVRESKAVFPSIGYS
ncbi:DUF255 domain-containing protein [Ferroacidibacillus organovorans]|uniref:Spermatogenesis-associated protein 20-like TRX domain-containing protein n=1 Tax=Ferroacidibacillus organovorans TaxID=1765683 RepID=A0A853K7H3_9BACL|nr:DUF255 domain-containing protein [Ferroacidibacillus organovorans]KYP79830.1 hypothetical protein AYJ22_13480 [Ferroacidibacillus organovorans]OAG92872.1 hypothetical protein AYW79_13055 [Ferroacidibacillus organovorans]